MSTHQQLTLAILKGADQDAALRYLQQASRTYPQVTVFPFVDYIVLSRRIHELGLENVQVRYPQTDLEQAVADHRDDYLARLRELPERAPRLLRCRGWDGLPLWWMSELRETNLMVWPAMLRVFTLLAIRRLLHQEADLALFTAIPDEGAVARRSFGNRLVHLHTASDPKTSLPRLLLSRFLNACRFFRLVGLAGKVSNPSPQSARALLLSFAYNLKQADDGTVRDRYFHDLAGQLSQQLPTALCVSLVGHRLGMSPRLAADLLAQVDAVRRDQRFHTIVLEAHLRRRDVIASFASPRQLWQELRLHTKLPPIHVAGMEVTDLLARELRQVIATAPYRRLSAVAMARLLAGSHVGSLTYYCYEYGYGRLMTAVCRQAGVRAIGMQHGPASHNDTLMRQHAADLQAGMPHPDHVLLDGELPKTIYAGDSLPPERFHPAGACRFDDLRIAPMAITRTAERPTIFVASGLHDGIQLARFVTRADIADQVRILFKPHPKYYLTAEQLGRQFPDLEMTSDPVESIFTRSDLIVSSYSSVGIEALIAGKLVVCIVPEGSVNLAPWGDAAPFAPVVRHPHELGQTIERTLQADPNQLEAARVDFVKQVFGPLDGRACQRAAHLIAEQTP